jgi:Zn-dependent M32 family carboxypeptidase
MKLGLVAAWNKIKASHKQLSDPKFKPDLGALLSKYETDFDEADDLQKQIEALKSGLVPFMKAMAETRGETRDQLEDARKQLVDQATAEYNKFLADYGDGSDWDVVQKACNTFTTTLKKFISGIDDCVKQLTQSRDASTKDEMTGISQYLVKRKQVEDKRTKVHDELDKLQDQIPQVVGSYIKIAKQMKDDDLADDINSILKKLPTPV